MKKFEITQNRSLDAVDVSKIDLKIIIHNYVIIYVHRRTS